MIESYLSQTTKKIVYRRQTAKSSEILLKHKLKSDAAVIGSVIQYCVELLNGWTSANTRKLKHLFSIAVPNKQG